MKMRKIILLLAIAVLILSVYSVHAINIINKDGKTFQAEIIKNKLYIIDSSGKKSLAKDGIYKTREGKEIVVKSGMVQYGKGVTLPGKDKGLKLTPAPGKLPGGAPGPSPKPGVPGEGSLGTGQGTIQELKPGMKGAVGIEKKKKVTGVPGTLTITFPLIQNVTAETSFSPGLRVFINGQRFGEDGGRILLHGQFDPNPRELVAPIWHSETKVSGVIPGDITGVPDHWTKYQIETKDMRKGNLFERHFIAAREVRLLAHDDPAITNRVCGGSCESHFPLGGADICDKQLSSMSSQFIGDPEPTPYTLLGYHLKGGMGCEGNDSWEIHLKNGWKLNEIKVYHLKNSSDVLLAPGAANVQMKLGLSDWTPGFYWETNTFLGIYYRYTVWIKGPKGTSHY